MIYEFPLNAKRLDPSGTYSRYDKEYLKLEFQEKVVISLVSQLAATNPKYLDDFGVNKAKKLWEISAYLAEERNYRFPRKQN